MHPEAAQATLSRPARRFNAGASERPRPLWPGMNATLTVLGGKHTRVMQRFGLVRSGRGSGLDARKQEMLCHSPDQPLFVFALASMQHV